jgi:Icc-related predicted phosphoesterase
VRKKHSHLEFYDIPDIDKYFNSKGTIQEDLNKIKVTNKTIMAIHSPPSGVGLDICRDRRAVGSQAVYNFIKKTNAAVVLAGHIHESPDMTGLWNIKIGKTVVVQPGQKEDSLTVVIIKILGNEVELERHHLEIY